METWLIILISYIIISILFGLFYDIIGLDELDYYLDQNKIKNLSFWPLTLHGEDMTWLGKTLVVLAGLIALPVTLLISLLWCIGWLCVKHY